MAALVAIGCTERVRPAPENAIVAVGDSLTAGYRLPPDDSWPAHLARLLGRPVINRGVSGETAAETLARVRREGLGPEPDVVIVTVGTNDILRGLPLEPLRASLRGIVEHARASGARVVVVGLEGYRSPIGYDHGAAYREIAREHGALYVPDLTRGVLGRPDTMRDAIHPNAAGNLVIAERLAAELRAWLAAPDSIP